MQIQLSEDQFAAIEAAGIGASSEEVQALLAKHDNIELLTTPELTLVLQIANATYRAGVPWLSDSIYDSFYVEALKQRDPNNAFLHSVEPEPVVASKTRLLPEKMLSTEKAYSFDEIKKWTERIIKAADELAIPEHEIELKITPKLDGYAAYDDGTTLYTRGDGIRGQDITRAFARGLQIAKSAARGLGAGEIVIQKSYFEQRLSHKFENSRNIQAAIIAEKKIDQDIQIAIDEGACVFYPFTVLEKWQGSIASLLADFEPVMEKMWHSVDFDIDGLIIETTNEPIKQYLGATRKFHKWQIAFKLNAASAEVEVIKVIPQTSRTGRVSPVAELVPTKLSGATLSRATVHHYNMVKTLGVGKGAITKLVRSGLVIPKIEGVIRAAEPDIPKHCPSCGADLIWESDHLLCPNKSGCPAQTENTLIHFFKTLGNVDGFGPKVVEKIAQSGVKHIHQIYQMSEEQFLALGFGDKTSQNLRDQLKASRALAIEDWIFLSAFGVTRLGAGNGEKLLQHYPLSELFDLSADQIARIDGFAELSAKAIVEGLKNIREEFFKVYNLGFNLLITPKLSDADMAQSPIAGKLLVFTGTMSQGSRGDMEKQAKLLGAKVGKSVSGKTDLLITGTNVGESKIAAAKDKGVNVIDETEYYALLDVQAIQ